MKNEVSTVNVEIIDGVPTIKANGRIFVIPNHAGSINSLKYHCQDSKNEKIKKLTDLCELNDRDIDDLINEPLIQLWIVSDDLKTNNLEDHGFRFNIGNEEFFGYAYGIGHLPKSFFDGKKEGDILSLKYKGWYVAKNDGNHNDMLLELNLELCQHEYRYKNFGQFEEVISKVCN